MRSASYPSLRVTEKQNVLMTVVVVVVVDVVQVLVVEVTVVVVTVVEVVVNVEVEVGTGLPNLLHVQCSPCELVSQDSWHRA